MSINIYCDIQENKDLKPQEEKLYNFNLTIKADKISGCFTIPCRKRDDCALYHKDGDIVCRKCSEYFIYNFVPKLSLFCEYIPTCSCGYKYCIYDPAYIHKYYPEYYMKKYGNVDPSEVGCKDYYPYGSDDCRSYDDEDK